jgi:hypothetical protein
MRPAIKAGLMVLLEAAGPFMRAVLCVSKATFCLSEFKLRKLELSVHDRQAGT